MTRLPQRPNNTFEVQRRNAQGNAQGKVLKMQLKDVAVLITGGGSGLGAATARALAAQGAKRGVIHPDNENAQKVSAQVKGVAPHADRTLAASSKARISYARTAHRAA